MQILRAHPPRWPSAYESRCREQAARTDLDQGLYPLPVVDYDDWGRACAVTSP